MHDRETKVDDDLGRTGYSVNTRPSRGTEGGHYHRGLEVMFVHSGEVEIHVGDWRRVLTPGDAVLNVGEIPHASRPLRKPFARTALHFLPQLTTRSATRLFSHEDEPAKVVTLPFDAAQRLLWATNQLETLGTAPAPEPTIKALFALIFAELAVAQATAARFAPARGLVTEVVSYMRDSTEREESLDELARRFAVSKSHLRNTFKDQVGRSPQQYWRKLRIEQACRLMLEGKTLQDVAGAVGFNSRRGFERAFQQVTGMAPGQYRERLLERHASRS